MNKSLVVPLALVGQLAAGAAFAQTPGRNVTVLRMSGPQLGVRLDEVDKDAVTRLKLKEESGALVLEVVDGSAASKAGLRKDDVIVRFQGEPVLTAAQLARLVRDAPSGRKVDLEVIRGGAPLRLTATLEQGTWSDGAMDLPSPEDLADKLHESLAPLRDPQLRRRLQAQPRAFNFRLDENGKGPMMFTTAGRPRLGITYLEVDGQLARYFKAPGSTAVLVNSVNEGSAAEKAGLHSGDIIAKIGSTSIADADDLGRAVGDLEGGKPTPITVLRDGRSVELSVTVEAERSESAPRRLRRPAA